MRREGRSDIWSTTRCEILRMEMCGEFVGRIRFWSSFSGPATDFVRQRCDVLWIDEKRSDT